MVFKGDLQSASLSDVLQMLFNNGKDGTLKVTSTEFAKTIYCCKDGVTLLNPEILETDRLADVIVSAGLARRKEVEKHLDGAGPDKKITDVLIEAEVLDQEAMDRILWLQIEEELLSVLALQVGEFEFFEKHEKSIPRNMEGLPLIPADMILIEVARRMDEWGYVRSHIRDLDGIFIREADWEEEEDPEAREFLDQVNGRFTIRQIADSLFSSTVKVAKQMALLVEKKMIRPAEPEDLLSLAQELLAHGDQDEGRAILRKLKPDLEFLIQEDEDVTNLADLYYKGGDADTASDLLLKKAGQAVNASAANDYFPFLDQARQIDPENMGILSKLADICMHNAGKEDRIRLLVGLAHRHLKEESFELALKVCTIILESDPSGTFVMDHVPEFPEQAGKEREILQVLEDFVVENMPDFLVEAGNKQGALTFLENLIDRMGKEWDPRLVAGLYQQIVSSGTRMTVQV